MYFLETNYTRVQRGIITKNSRIQSKAKQKEIRKLFEAGDHLCESDSNASEISPSKCDHSNSVEVSVRNCL